MEPSLANAQRLCLSSDLQDGGRAFLFEVRQYDRIVGAFAVRYAGQVAAYLNRCAHVPSEMDWQSGEFFDADRRYLMCSIHGAIYEPLTGLCVAGPCVRKRLSALSVQEHEGAVYWYPSEYVQAVF